MIAFLLQLKQAGLVSSHFFFLLRQVTHPVLDRTCTAFIPPGAGSGCLRGRPRLRGATVSPGVRSVASSNFGCCFRSLGLSLVAILLVIIEDGDWMFQESREVRRWFKSPVNTAMVVHYTQQATMIKKKWKSRRMSRGESGRIVLSSGNGHRLLSLDSARSS
jgi:hypothetical protein